MVVAVVALVTTRLLGIGAGMVVVVEGTEAKMLALVELETHLLHLMLHLAALLRKVIMAAQHLEAPLITEVLAVVALVRLVLIQHQIQEAQAGRACNQP
jgi:hypothetical protein